LNPIPAEEPGRTIGGDSKRERLVAEGEELVVLHFMGTRELLPEDTIVEGSLICEG